MRTALSLMLIVPVFTSAQNLTAQERSEFANPISRAIRREAASLAAASSADTSTRQRVEPAPSSDWARVTELPLGLKIRITKGRGLSATRYFLAADENGITVLNIADPSLPATVAGVLRDTVSMHPEYFNATRNGGRLMLEKHVSLEPGGVFLSGRKVAELQDIFEVTPRTDVMRLTQQVRKHPILWGMLIGAGGAIGIVALTYLSTSCSGADCTYSLFVYSLQYGVIGAGFGAATGAALGTHSVEQVVYQAP